MGRKTDLKEVDRIAKEGGLTPEERDKFGEYLEDCKASGDKGTKNQRGTLPRRSCEKSSRNLKALLAKAMADEGAMIVDLKQEVKNSADLWLLDLFLKALLGQRCLKARLSYGDELKIHFGEPQPINNPKLASIQRGAWVLAARASPWRAHLNRPGILLASGWHPGGFPAKGVSPQAMAEYANKLSGAEVVSAHISQWWRPPELAPGLILAFGDGSNFELAPGLPTPEDVGNDEQLADWELFTPYKTYLRVGPGPVWSNLPSDGPPTTNE